MTKRIFAMILCMVIFLCACGRKAEESAEGDAPNPPTATEAPTATTTAERPQKGGLATLAMRLPQTLNPILNTDKTVDLALRLIFEPLAVLDERQKPKPNPAIADKLDFAQDGMSVTVTLREGAEWSDGTPVTARDVRFTIEAMRGAEGGLYHACAQNIAACEALDDKTARITFLRPFCGAAYLLRFPVIPEAYYKGAADDDKRQMQPLGDGLYTFDDYNVTDGMLLSASSNAAAGAPYIDAVKVLIARDEAAEANLFDQRVTDALTAFVADGGKYKGSEHYRAETYTTNYFDFIGFNFEREYLQNVNARRAIAQAVPLERIRATAYIGGVSPAAAPVAPESRLYEPNVTAYPYDTAPAAAAFKNHPTPLTLLINDENPERAKAAAQIQESLAEAGVTVDVIPLPFDDYAARLEAGDFDLFLGGYSLDALPVFDFLFHSGGNLLRYQNNAMDLLLENVFTATGDDALKSAASDLQKYIADDLPIIGVGFRQAPFAVSARVHGALKPSAYEPLEGFGGWYIVEG